MTTRRPWGAGSIVERRPGVWRVIVALEPDPWTGARRQLTATVRGSKREAQARLDRLRADHPRQPATSATVAALMAEWFPAAPLKASSRGDWRPVIERHILPTIGDRRLRDLRPPHIEAWHAHLAERGLSPASILTCHTILSTALTYAGRMGWTTENVAQLAARPKVKRAKRQPLEPEAVTALADAARSPMESAWVQLAIVTGARRGELGALRWTDLDPARSRLTIARGWSKDGRGGWVESTTKKDTVNVVELGPSTMALLLGLLGHVQGEALRAGVELAPDAFILSSSIDGRAPTLPRQVNRIFARLSKRAGLPPVQPHDLRRTTASVTVARVGAAPAQRRLGHSSLKQLDTYASSLREDDHRAALALDDLFR